MVRCFTVRASPSRSSASQALLAAAAPSRTSSGSWRSAAYMRMAERVRASPDSRRPARRAATDLVTPPCAADHGAVADLGCAPRRPTWPARVTRSPDARAPGDADLGAEDRVLADLHVVGDLDQVVDPRPPADAGHAGGGAVDRSVLAPISTSSSITTRPICGIFGRAGPSRRRKPKPSSPITAPAWMITRSPISRLLRGSRRWGRSGSRRPMLDVGRRSPRRGRIVVAVADAARARRSPRAARWRPRRPSCVPRADQRRGVDARPGAGAPAVVEERPSRQEGGAGIGARGCSAGRSEAMTSRQDDARRPACARATPRSLRVGEEGDLARRRPP